LDVLVHECGIYDENINRLSKAGTGGDGTTLAGAEVLYRRPVTVVVNVGLAVPIGSLTSSSEATSITLSYIGTHDSLLQFHYVSLKPTTSTPPLATDSLFAISDILSSAATRNDNSKASTSSESSITASTEIPTSKQNHQVVSRTRCLQNGRLNLNGLLQLK
jgi:hypothetical protein